MWVSSHQLAQLNRGSRKTIIIHQEEHCSHLSQAHRTFVLERTDQMLRCARCGVSST